MNKFELLIVEDDRRLAKLIGSFFSRSGFNVTSVENGTSAVDYCKNNNPTLIILDLMLPDFDGFTVCRMLRSFYKGRILMLTASSSDIDQVVGFESGIDDYVVKPVEPRVLLARVNALINRSLPIESCKESSLLHFDKLSIDNQSKTVEYNKNSISFTSHEFELLFLLASKAGEVLSRDKIYTCLRGFGYDGSNRSVDLKISRIRKKLGDDANQPQKIKTIWSKGYLFVPTAWSD